MFASSQLTAVKMRSTALIMSHRYFQNSKLLSKKSKNSVKGKSVTSQNWLNRQLRDPFVKDAAAHNWRCRSAFKLIELDDRFRILKPGSTVIDCGAAPGSWCQVASQRVAIQGNSARSGVVIGVDLLPISPIPGVILLEESDFTHPTTQENILNILNGKKANCVISDMAPNATGIKSMDHEQIISLGLSALQFSRAVLKQNGHFVCKIWQGSEEKNFENILRGLFRQVDRFKPRASRNDSSELYLVAQGAQWK